MLYIVSNSDYDCYCPVYVEGPQRDDWEGYCRSLLDDAAKRAVDNFDDRWIGSAEIVESLVSILCENGYQRVRPESFDLNGPGIIDESDKRPEDLSPSSKAIVGNHNLHFHAKLYNCDLATAREQRGL